MNMSSEQMEIQRLRRLLQQREEELRLERKRLDTLEYLGVRTGPSNYGLWDCRTPPGFRIQWVTKFGSKHESLRQAIDQVIVQMQLASTRRS